MEISFLKPSRNNKSTHSFDAANERERNKRNQQRKQEEEDKQVAIVMKD